MRILYVANHGSGGNEDELEIVDCLRELGHDVTCIQEKKGYAAISMKADLLLFHKWDDVRSLQMFDGFKVFWYFDLVTYPDSTLARRCQRRVDWMKRITPHVDIGFCTDGDWVETDSKYICLRQGSRIPKILSPGSDSHSILFTGGQNGGVGRKNFVDKMKREYGGLFTHIQNRYLDDLATTIAGTKIVVAPDHPATHKYWSNRVYMSMGYGAFMLHPYCVELSYQYEDGEEIVFYHSWNHLKELISKYIHWDTERLRISRNGMMRTKGEHTYKHRCEQLIRLCEEIGGTSKGG